MTVTSAATDTPGLTRPSERGFSSRLIGDVVVDLGFAPREVVDTAVARARGTGRTTGQVLLETGAVTDVELSRVVAERFGMDHVDLERFALDPVVTGLVALDVLRRHRALPVGWADATTLRVVVAEPSNVLAIDDISLLTGYSARPAIAAADAIDRTLDDLARGVDLVAEIVAEDTEELLEDLATDLGGETADDAPVVRLVHSILQQAIQRGASDVHFAPHHDGALHSQLRIDGILQPGATVPRRMAAGVISRIKIMADLDIAERRAPQDGRISLSVAGRDVDVRVVILPLVGGESVVMRILDRSDGQLSLDHLGLPAPERRRLERACSRTNGAILVTGPTGSGKTTTLYASLAAINSGEKGILTIEDPVEYRMAGVRQMQVNAKAGVTFASGLRSMLRADPDIVMVGEIRDGETAHIAIEAALTGHLVLSTLHTNDAPSAVTRLLEMGVEPFLVASAVRCIVAQRLARRLCEDCRRPVRISAEAMRLSGFPVEEEHVDAYEAAGCAKCGDTGFRGRIGFYEVLDVDDAIHDLVVHRASARDIAAAAEAAGMRRLPEVALERVRAGETSVSEVARVLGGG